VQYSSQEGTPLRTDTEHILLIEKAFFMLYGPLELLETALALFII
jgi:hypothetical protein